MSESKSNWFKRHKILTAIGVLIILGVVVSASSGNKSDNGVSSNQSSNATAAKTYRFDDRADKQKEDIEALPGEVATVDGVKLTLTNVEYKTQLGEYDNADAGKTYVVADVALENTSGGTKSYNVFDFRIQTASGQVLDGAISTITTIGSGDMVSGGKVSGKIVFEVPVEDGHQYVIWKPGAFDAARAVIQVK